MNTSRSSDPAARLRRWLTTGLLSAGAAMAAPPLASFDEAMRAGRDLWGEAAMAQPNGASYDFFASILPPPRYVNADFRYYPIVLSAPGAATKARLISNGSGVNLRGGARSWNDPGTPFRFRVGPDEYVFGTARERLQEPTLADGYLPIVEIRYQHRTPVQSEGAVPLVPDRPKRAAEIYRLEAFASTDPALAANAVVFVNFTLAQGESGLVTISLDDHAPVKFAEGQLTNDRGEIIGVFDSNWKWTRERLQARVTAAGGASLALPTKPLPAGTALKVDYAAQRGRCADTWREMLARGMSVETPEPIVNHAWRNLLLQNFALLKGGRIHYSAGNQYDQMYEGEGSDAALAMLGWGFADDTRRMIGPLLDFTRKGLEYHQAGFKLLNVCRYYWQTRDAAAVQAWRSRWEQEARRIAENRTGPHGLLPAERYTGDISTPAQAVNANAQGWRALRDLGAVLGAMGEQAEARRYAEIAREFRATVLRAIEENTRRETSPPFIPVALYSNEPAHSPILHSRIGSYWNIIIGYTIGSGIFPPGSPEEQWIPRYQEQHGGICMGMIRSGSGGEAFNFWTGEHRVNPLYGTRYALDTLRRDDPERALVSFYGMLAQGVTRNTFVGGEGGALAPMDDGGRIFYCPPNSAGNGHLLSMLRHLLVQDWDLDDDGEPETLRLLFATPKRWLEDGQSIRIERAPTVFGPVSVSITSRLSRGEVVAEFQLPHRQLPKRTLLRARVPDGWRVVSAQERGQVLPVDANGTVDLSSLRGAGTVRFHVERR